MSITERQRTIAVLWLFSAGVDPDALDTEGDNLLNSLCKLLANEHKEGVVSTRTPRTIPQASGQFRMTGKSVLALSEDEEDEVTGSYPKDQEDKLRRCCQ